MCTCNEGTQFHCKMKRKTIEDQFSRQTFQNANVNKRNYACINYSYTNELEINLKKQKIKKGKKEKEKRHSTKAISLAH